MTSEDVREEKKQGAETPQRRIADRGVGNSHSAIRNWVLPRHHTEANRVFELGFAHFGFQRPQFAFHNRVATNTSTSRNSQQPIADGQYPPDKLRVAPPAGLLTAFSYRPFVDFRTMDCAFRILDCAIFIPPSPLHDDRHD